MAIVFTITDAGRAALVDADHDGTTALTLSEIGFGRGRYTPSADQTALREPIKRLASMAGQAVAADTLHVSVQDESSDTYAVGEIGLFTDAGVLFAVYSQSEWIIEKAAPSTLLLATDLVVEALDVSAITFGDAAFLNPPATTEVAGVLELATQAEVDAGGDARRGVVPRTLKVFLDKVLAAYATLKQLNDHAASRNHPAATTNAQGMVELATYAETKEGSDNARAVTPAANKSALDAHRTEGGAHAATRISVEGLAKLGNPTTVQNALGALGTAARRDEGPGKGLDADTVDGRHADDLVWRRGQAHQQIAGGLKLWGAGHASANVADGYGLHLSAFGPGVVFADRTTNAGSSALWFDNNRLNLTYSPSGNANPGASTDAQELLTVSPSFFRYLGKTIWHAGNQGSGSGLDADKLDGLHSADFVRDIKGNATLEGTQPTLLFKTNGGNDQGGVRFNNPTGNDGELEFFTSDDYAEPFVFRAYDRNDQYASSDARREWARIDNAGIATDATLRIQGKEVYHPGNASDLATIAGTNDLRGVQLFRSITKWAVDPSSANVQRADARVDGNQARLHWYGEDQDGKTANFRHAWYDGSKYINVSADNGGVVFDATRPWLTLDSPNSGDNALSQGAGLSIGESGQRGDAALHLTYVGDGSGHIGMGAVGDDGIPANAAMRLYYRSKDVTFNGKISGNGAGLSGVDADRLQGLQASQFLRSDTGNNKVPLGSTSSTNWDGLVYDDGANTLAFFADQDPSADTPRVLLGPGWVEAGGDRLLKEKDYDRATIKNDSGDYLGISKSGYIDLKVGGDWKFRVTKEGRIDRAEGGIEPRLINVSVGAVGTYAFLKNNDSSAADVGATKPGSKLSYTAAWNDDESRKPSGTWMCMGKINRGAGENANTRSSVWYRIS
ncbi:hypothetical protein EVC62_04190 [Salinicola endophyticus]|uniref:Phage tail protein n=1 Tax=Salinicola endophyticus TaxID=1949083 RepID=A0ABY8FD87_9GAMM|nr:hypothetical protein [Salinicola endophyticus]WFF40760.1 hypothetical protein EVC62_04190 [Salinicola endophyticus]